MLAGLSLALSTTDVTALRYLDLVVLAMALPVFLAADLPMLGYVVVAGVWLVQRVVQLFAERRVADALARGDRRTAMGLTAGTGLGRVWLIALAVLLVGLLGDRDAGLAAAVLAAVLFTAYLATQMLGRLFADEAPGESA